MKNLQLIVCPNCWEQGDNLHRTKEGDLICGRCGHRWREDTAKELEEILTSRLDAEKQKACIRARHNLYQQVKAENISSVAVLQWTQEVKKYFPDDFLANFYEIACGKDKSRLPNFIEETDMMKEKTFLPAALDFLLRSPTDHFLTNALRIVERAYNNGAMEQGVCTEYRTRISQLQQQCDEGYFVASLPRDVFIAYSSADMSAVNELEAYLNQQGFSTFVAAHNLMHGVGAVENYEEEIETALHHCKAFVFVSTPHSRTMKCDAMGVEVKWVREHAPHMSRIEYRPSYDINESQPVAKDILKEFFKGCQPCNSKEEVYHRLVEKLYSVAVDTATPSPTPVEAPKPAVKTAGPKKAVSRTKPPVVLANYDKSEFRILGTVLKKYKGIGKNVTIPEGVTEIGEEAFWCCNTLVSVTIPEGVTSIGKYAFHGCTSLTGITIPNSVTSIGSYAFQGCTSLTSITIPNSVTSIEVNTFAGCTSLTSITIPNSVTSIEVSPFAGCTSLTSITIPNSVTSIGGWAFQNCESLTSITIPSSVTSIGDYAFCDCTSLTSIETPNSLTSIGVNTFKGCTSLTSLKFGGTITQWKAVAKQCVWEDVPALQSIICSDGSVLPAVTLENYDTSEFEIEGTVLKRYTRKKKNVIIPYSVNVTIPEGVTEISNEAFKFCSLLSSIMIPNSVTSIGDGAFYCCTSLTSITIPSSVTSIGSYAFYGCTSLTSITIPSSVTSIGSFAFLECKKLTSLTMLNGVTSIGKYAFHGCTSLTSITIPSSVTVIESGVFSNCTSLTSLKFLGTRAQWKTAAKQWKREVVPTLQYVICSDDSIVPTLTLENCDKSEFEIEGTVLKKYKGSWTRYTDGKIIIPEGITRIDDSAFIDCKSLVSVTIPDSVTSIGERAFDGCKSLKSITIPSSVTSIGNRAFDACPLEYLSVARGNPVYHSEWSCLFDTRTNTLIRGSKCGLISKTITYSIGDRAFYGCTSLTYITIPTSVTSIGENAFAACEMLSTVDILRGVTSICQEAFMGCDLLRAVTIPESVTSIGADVFRGCKMLTSLKYLGTKKQWKAIKKDRGWKGGSFIKSVICSDGELKI